MDRTKREEPPGKDTTAPRDRRRPYTKPRVRSSEVFERAAGCAPAQYEPPCVGTS